MFTSNEHKIIFRILVIFFIFFSLLLSACVNKEVPNPKTPEKTEMPKGPTKPASQASKWKLPIAFPNGVGEFDKVVGWVSDFQIIYVTNLEQTSNVVLYNLTSGTNQLIYKTDHPIVNVQISPSKHHLLIHSAPSSYEGLVTIIDTTGNVQWKKSFPSYELVFEWNPYNESEVLVSAFEEDWSYQLFLVDMKRNTTRDISLPQPFIKWIHEDEISYIAWDEDTPSLVAPLIVKGLKNEVEKTLLPAAIQFSTYHDLLMTVSVNEQDKSLADYSFYDNKFKRIFSFSLPQLTKFSDWLVPFYDYNSEKKQVITFSPHSSGEFDTYTDGFQLLSFDLKKGSKKLIMDGLENEPIAFSPSGNFILYGNRFEKVIDHKNTKMYELVKE